MPEIPACVTVIWFVVFALMYVVATFVAAAVFVGVNEQCPLEVIPVIVKLSLVAAVVVIDTAIVVALLPSGIATVRDAPPVNV